MNRWYGLLKHDSIQKWLWGLSVLGSCCLLFVLTFNSYIKYYNSDPELTLLVAQTILEQGTIKLDSYEGQMVLGRPFEELARSPKVIKLNGHVYSYFPLGPAVLSLPFVAISQAGGLDMSTTGDNYKMQKGLASLAVVAVFLILWQTARLFVGKWASLVFSLVATLGSTITSTMGTALWSINFATVFVTWALFLLAKGSHSWSRLTPYGLGLLLFLAFFVRVSTAAFIAPVMLYLLLHERKVWWKTAVAALIPLILFLTWSRLEFGQWLPAYYSAARLVAERVALWVGVYGNLLSASRGIFVFSPFLALGMLGCWRWEAERPLILVIFVWFGLLLLIISRGASWWGGVAFGPRLLTEVVPGLALLVVFAWRNQQLQSNQRQRQLWLAVYSLLALFSVVVHGFQGLYNLSAVHWNHIIAPIPQSPILGLGDLFNWRYTQLLASPNWQCAIVNDRTQFFLAQTPIFTPYPWGEELGYYEGHLADALKNANHPVVDESIALASPLLQPHSLFLPFTPDLTTYAIFTGLVAQPGERSADSYCHDVTMYFRLGAREMGNEVATLRLTAVAEHDQQLILFVNGQRVAEQRLEQTDGEGTAVSFTIPTTLLNFSDLNEIRIELPDAQFTTLKANKYEGFRFEQVILLPGASANYPLPLPSPSAYP